MTTGQESATGATRIFPDTVLAFTRDHVYTPSRTENVNSHMLNIAISGWSVQRRLQVEIMQPLRRLR